MPTPSSSDPARSRHPNPPLDDRATVVAGTDGSASSMHAVAVATRLAARRGARLLLVCAHHRVTVRTTAARATGVFGEAPADAGAAERALFAAREHAEAVLTDPSLPATEVEIVATLGHPGPALAVIAADHDAELIVVGDRGGLGRTGRLLGSVPGYLVRNAFRDVLIARPGSSRSASGG